MSTQVVRIHGGETLNDVVAGNIRAALARQRWTGRQVAKALGVGHNKVAVRLRGEAKIDIDFLVQVADLLKISPAELLPEGSAPTHPAGGQPHRGDNGPSGNTNWYNRASLALVGAAA